MCDYFSVDGKWGAWSHWTECSATCGAAKRSRTRECDHPPAAHGGKTCEGPEKQEEYCKLDPCLGKCVFHNLCTKGGVTEGNRSGTQNKGIGCME